MDAPLQLLASQLADPQTGWSLGTFGAIAEFTRDPGEPAAATNDGRAMAVVTARGGIRLDRRPDIRLLASEVALEESWNHRIAICLPSEACVMSRRTVVTELGPDADALRAEDRAATLFDLGLEALQVDVCVRSADANLLNRLRGCVGRSIFEPGNPAFGMILQANPHRVFVSRVGRVEVYQPIPGPGGASPEGPHTHVLPKLLGLRRTHASTEPIPNGFIPCAHSYPPHPGRDGHGRARPLDRACHDSFQVALRAFGDAQLNALKQAVIAAVTAGQPPDSVAIAKSRHAHGCVRVALRQLQATGAASATLDDWNAVYFRGPEARRR
jgi:hypothetical protein